MARVINAPTRIEAAGNLPKIIEEFIGGVTTGMTGRVQMFLDGKFDVAHLFYSRFKSALAQIPTEQQIIPVKIPADATSGPGRWVRAYARLSCAGESQPLDDLYAALVAAVGQPGEVYNIGAGNEITNKELTYRLLELTGRDESFIRPVDDRKGHDRRYSLSTKKLEAMGWAPQVPFEQGLKDTVAWYQANEWWWRPIKERDANYKAYMDAQYGKRG